MWEPRILIVEDELGPRESYRQILKNDYEVILMDNGKSAIEYVSNHPVDVALLDIRMPDIDGIEVLKQIKTIRPEIEVTMVTAYASVDNAKNAIKYGAMDYLIKPASVREIKAVVQKAVAKRIQHMQYNNKLSELLEVSQSITSNLDAQRVRKSILDWTEKLFWAPMAWLSLYNPKSKEIELAEVRGPLSEEIVNTFSHDGKGITEAVIAKKQIIIIPDVIIDDKVGYKGVDLETEIKSIVVLPLVTQGQIIGVLGFSSPVVHEVTYKSSEHLEAGQDELLDRQYTLEAMNMNFLTIFANHAAIALQNAQLYSDLRYSEQKLQDSLKQVMASLEEKKVLLSEIHHRVKNNLQIISSLLSLQTKYIEDENYREIFKDSQNRIRVMSSIHEKLYQSEDLAQIDFEHYIKDLASSLFRTYAIIDRIALKTEIEDVSLSINFAIPCGLILNELISNSLKYAFPEDRKGEIKITIRCVEDKVELVVSDNGIGMPEDLDFRNTKSLGLQLVTNIVENQLQGQIELNRTEGTEFQIKFKAAE